MSAASFGSVHDPMLICAWRPGHQPRVFLRLHYLPDAALGANAYFRSLHFQLPVFGLPSIGAHGLGLVAEVARLVDRRGRLDRAAGCIVSDQRVHDIFPWHHFKNCYSDFVREFRA